jgi:hypothetical protein
VQPEDQASDVGGLLRVNEHLRQVGDRHDPTTAFLFAALDEQAYLDPAVVSNEANTRAADAHGCWPFRQSR